MKQKISKRIDRNKKETFLNISLAFNVVMVILSLIACLILYLELNPFSDVFPPEERGYHHMKYFTNFSVLLAGFISLANVILLILMKAGKLNIQNKTVYFLSLFQTVNLSITIVSILFIMLPFVAIKGHDFFEPGMLVSGSNLIAHLLLPIVCIINFICFVNPSQQIKLKETLYSFIPLGIYGIIYVAIALTHIDQTTGIPPKTYDGYYVFQFGYGYSPLFLIGFLAIGFLFAGLLGLCNRKINAKIYSLHSK